MVEIDHIYQYLRSTDGVNQLQRSIPALDPYFVRMDERRNPDLIRFVRALAEQVRYYNFNDSPQGNWLQFFNFPNPGSSIVAKAATVAALPLVKYENGISGAGATLTSLATGILPEQDGVGMGNGDMLLVWQQQAGFQNGVYSVTQGTATTPFVLTRFQEINHAAAYNEQVVEIAQGTQHVRKFFVQRTVNPVIGTSNIVYAPAGDSRKDWPPHLALFMSFLRLYSIAQKDLNELTGRHLRYYYEHILKLQRRASQPDQVHVVFEPAKNALPTLITAGTLLDAGKAKDGKTPRQYALDNDIVVTQAIIESLKSSFTEIDAAGNAIIFKAEDATLVKSENGTNWRPFGDLQLHRSPESRTMTEAILGFAVATPALLLAEGERTVKLSLQLQSAAPFLADQGLTYVFEVELTGEKGWIVPTFLANYTAPVLTTPPRLELTAVIPATADPVIPFDEALHGAGYGTRWPVIRCKVKPQVYQLENLGNFIVQQVDVDVTVKGVKNLILQSDESVQPADKPVTAFSSQPSVGSNFYIGSTEVFSKTVQSLSVALEWKDLPENLNDYYRGYDNPNISYDKFLADLFLLAGRTFNTLLLLNQSLFNGSSTDTIKRMTIDTTNFNTQVLGSGFKRNPDLGLIEKYNNNLNQGFIKLVLKGPTPAAAGNLPVYAPFEAFGHRVFPTIYTHKAIDLSVPTGDGLLPNPPYTPVLKSVTLDYSAKESFIPNKPNGIDQFFQIDIFGNAEIKKNETARIVPLYPQQGALYIGLKNATPPQSVSFLFQIEKGDMPGGELLNRQDVQWSYLAGNQWQTITAADLLEEATDTFQKPGLVRLNIGTDATTGGTLLSPDLHWVRVLANQRADGAGAIQEIVAQAARATLVSSIADASLLPAGVITRLVKKIPSVKSVKQNYPSVNGRATESDTDFFRRSSERLRHRNRAVQAWDYERLVMEAFPEVFKIKSLPHIDQDNNIAPGHIKLVIVPDMRLRPGSSPLQPRNNLAFLRGIETLLKDKYLDGFVVPHAANPEYETLLVDCKVAFLPNFDPGYYSVQLQEDIRRFLSPWAYEEGRDIIFGGKVYKSEILAFVEGRPYVDYIVDFQLYHRYEGEGLPEGIGCMTIGDDFVVSSMPIATISNTAGTVAGAAIGVDFIIGEPSEVAVATRPDAILVSNPVHRIEALQSDDFECQGVSTIGIGQMIIGLDFIPL